jgi:chaperonin GroES
MTFRPLHDRVLVRRIGAAEKTGGGIIIPDTAKENRRKARSLLPTAASAPRTAL